MTQNNSSGWDFRRGLKKRLVHSCISMEYVERLNLLPKAVRIVT
jgi:hypothetical protein